MNRVKNRVRKQACFPPAACEPELLEALHTYAHDKDMSYSAVLRQAVRLFLSENMPKSTVIVDNGMLPEEA